MCMAAALLLSSAAQACSCMEDLGLAAVMRWMPVLVEGRVTHAPGEHFEPLAFELTRAFKGQVPRHIRITDTMMCPNR